jgi:hypothetical protein
MNSLAKYSFIFLLIFLFPFFSFGQCEVILTDTFVCHFGNNIVLSPTVNGSSMTNDYRIDELPFSYVEHQTPNFLQLQDDQVSEAINIGFEFEFYGNKFSQIYIGSNGWISFSSNQSVNYLSTSIPSANDYVPKNAIFAAWEDWNPSIGGVILYELFENDSNEYFVVSFENISHFVCDNDSETQGTFQIVLNKSDNSILTNIENKSSCLNVTSLQGIINADGNIAKPVTGRNSTVWSVNLNSIKYTPANNSYFNWLIDDEIVYEQDSLNLNLYNDQDISLLYWDDLGCYSQVNFNVSVLPEYNLNVNRVGDVLFSSIVEEYFSYQWYFDNEIIEGETNHFTNLNEEGVYFIQLQNLQNGCFYNSRIHLYVTASNDEGNKLSAKLFPQPSSGSFSINTREDILKAQIYDYKGLLVYEIINPSTNTFNLDLSSGVYFAYFQLINEQLISRLIISK